MTTAVSSGVPGTGPGLRVRRIWLVPVIAVLVLSPFLFTSLAVKRPVWDELWFHIDVARAFGPGLPDLATLRDYNSAVGPGFYILSGNVGALFGYRLFWLRLMVFAFAVGNVLLLLWLVRRLESDDPLPLLLVTISYYGLLELSGLFMSDQPALFFGLAGLVCYIRFQEARRPMLLATALALTAIAILFRQYYIFLPVGYATSELAGSLRNWKRALVALTPVLVLLPFALLWAGLTPRALQQRYHPGFTLGGTSSILVWAGASLFPWLLLELRRRSWVLEPWMLAALAGIPVVLLAPDLGPGWIRSALNLLPGSGAMPVKFVLAVAGAGSLLLIGASVREANKVRRALAFAGLSAVGLLCLSGPTLWERHFLPAYPLLLLALARQPGVVLPVVWGLGVHVPIAAIQLLIVANS